MHSAKSKKAHDLDSVSLWKIPAHSPDLNPIEKFWAWSNRELRHRDLADLKSKAPPLTKTKYMERVKQVLQTQKAANKVASIIRGFRQTLKEIEKKKGAAARS